MSHPKIKAQISIFASCTILVTFFLYPSILNNIANNIVCWLMKIKIKKFKR